MRQGTEPPADRTEPPADRTEPPADRTEPPADRTEPPNQTKLRIQAVAERLFMEQGIQATSLADIAKTAQISKGTLFYHYRSKDDLILAIAFSHVGAIGSEALGRLDARAEPADIRRLLTGFLESLLSASLRNHLHVYLLEESIRGNDSLLQAMRAKYREWLDSFIRVLQPRYGAEANRLAPCLLAMADGLIVQSLLGLPILDLASVAGTILPDPGPTIGLAE